MGGKGYCKERYGRKEILLNYKIGVEEIQEQRCFQRLNAFPQCIIHGNLPLMQDGPVAQGDRYWCMETIKSGTQTYDFCTLVEPGLSWICSGGNSWQLVWPYLVMVCYSGCNWCAIVGGTACFCSLSSLIQFLKVSFHDLVVSVSTVLNTLVL